MSQARVSALESLRDGDKVECQTASGTYVWMRVIGSQPVVRREPKTWDFLWVCTEGDYRLEPEGRTREVGFRRIPWPTDSIRAVQRRRCRGNA